MLIAGANVTDIATRVARPESNGTVERLHRTHRDEVFAESPEDYYHALELMTGHAAF